MSKDICFVEISFENIEYIKIPAHYFKDFELADIRTTVRRAAANAVLRYATANSVSLEFEPEANQDGKSFEGDVHSIQYENGCLFDRLQQNDITEIKLIYADETEEEFSVVWADAEDNEYRNRLQSSFINDSGRLRVQIQENK